MKIERTIYVDERDIRQAIADYVCSKNAGEGPIIKPNDIVFTVRDGASDGAISASSTEA